MHVPLRVCVDFSLLLVKFHPVLIFFFPFLRLIPLSLLIFLSSPFYLVLLLLLLLLLLFLLLLLLLLLLLFSCGHATL